MGKVRQWLTGQRHPRLTAFTLALTLALTLAMVPVTNWAAQRSAPTGAGTVTLTGTEHWPAGVSPTPSGAGPAEGGLAGLGVAPESTAGPGPDAAGGAPDDSTEPRQPPSRGNIEVGSTVQLEGAGSWAEAFARADEEYGPVHMLRVFHSGLPPAWPGSPSDVAGRTVNVSFKAAPQEVLTGQHDAALRGWFEDVPADRDIYWTYFHEPEDNIERGDFTAAEYRQAWQHVAALAREADNSRLYATLVLMGWSVEPASGRDWRDYYPGDDVIAVLGWDVYNFDYRIDEYSEPAAMFDRVIEASRSVDKPWGVAEFGGRRVTGDESGHERAAWIRANADFLAGHASPPLWVAWYDAEIGDGEQYGLVDEPSRTAWRDFVHSQQP